MVDSLLDVVPAQSAPHFLVTFLWASQVRHRMTGPAAPALTGCTCTLDRQTRLRHISGLWWNLRAMPTLGDCEQRFDRTQCSTM